MANTNLASKSILIAAFSGRALAQSAARAGYRPLVVDCFGDLDMRAAADAWRCLPARVQVGFLKRPLIDALDELAEQAPTAPVGLVLGAGFECNPRLVAALAERYSLIGNSADTIRRVKDPETFFSTLDTLGIRHPETRRTPPNEAAGWLMKRVGGSGGLHIHDCPAEPRPDPRRYFQRFEPGEPVSLLGITSQRGAAFAATGQWTNPRPRRRYRYGGAVSGLRIDVDLETVMIDVALDVSKAFQLVGLVSFDFIVSPEGEPILLEVNPRPGASLDVLDDSAGTLFEAHVTSSVAARAGQSPATLLQSQWRPPRAKAAAYLYADRSELAAPPLDWPGWAADRPAAGTKIGRGQPLATVIAEAETPSEAIHLCRERLGILERLVYDAQIEREP
ncbi:MAG: ATP-grasp domain-containing protein [Hyphomicrobium sp.]|nr:ATP-grasp domain-containing protein [Hyphomicrobium sp.]